MTMNTDKLMEMVAELRGFADEARASYAGEHASGTFRAVVKMLDDLAAVLRAEQAVGEEQRAREDLNAARRERDELREQLEYAEMELAYLANRMQFNGNSIGWIASKADNYRRAIDEAWSAMRAAGHGPDGNTPLHEAIRRALGAARQSEGMVVSKQMITPTCRANRGNAGALTVAVGRIADAYQHYVEDPNNVGVEWHLTLTRVAAAPGGEGEGK